MGTPEQSDGGEGSTARGTKKPTWPAISVDGKPRGRAHYERAGGSAYFMSFLLLLLAGNILTSAM